MSQIIVDVREADEYEIEHIEHSINVPLSNFTFVAPGVLNHLPKRQIIIMCRSGKRAQQAYLQAKNLGYDDSNTFSVYDGGILKWVKEGQPVMKKMGKSPLPLMRQMQLIMGLLFIVFASLGTFINPWFSSATIFLGIGLLITGMTGNCAVAGLLAKAPWNKTDPNLQANYCKASGNCK